MALHAGDIVKGRNATYRLLNVLHAPTVFKAQVLDSSTIRSRFAVVKTALEDKTKTALRRERNNYLIPGIRSSPYIRKQLDVLKGDSNLSNDAPHADKTDTVPPGLVFEWMEHDRWHVLSAKFRHTSVLPKSISRAVLSALALLKTRHDAIHTDINPNNILLSAIDTPSPIIKVGDLGNMFRDGYHCMRLQCLECRAPEVWRGLGVWHSSDVWSLGVTLAHWLSHSTIFGARDKIVEGLTEAWCIAKIRRLVGPVEGPVNADYDDEFQVGEYLERGTYRHQDGGEERRYITVGTLPQELEKLPGPKVDPGLLDFIEHLLVVDHAKRPTAAKALGHPYLLGCDYP